MANQSVVGNGFNAAPIIDYQVVLSADKPSMVPGSYDLVSLSHTWLAYDRRLRLTQLRDRDGQLFAVVVGFPYSDFGDAFLPAGEVAIPIVINSVDDLERLAIPKLAGLYVLFTAGSLPPRVYMDHGGSFPLVYSAEDRRAASSPALLLDEKQYHHRFRRELHEQLIEREGGGGWISGALTAHEDVRRVLPNHYLDLASWKAHRFWPRAGDFRHWLELGDGARLAAAALGRFSGAATKDFQVAVTMTAGFDSRLLLAGCRDVASECEFFTLAAPGADLDMSVSQALARRFGLNHRVMPLRQATDLEIATWDRMVGDCMREAPRQTHVTLRDLNGRDAVFTGMYGEVGRCRLYRQDFRSINEGAIDERFILDRLTLPPQPELLADVAEWLAALAGQPNSVILDLAFLELKFGSWAMGQRPISNSIKLNFLPFAQRPVFEAFIGVAPAQKETGALFWEIIKVLWPELSEFPINKYGDLRDYMAIWKKLSNANRVKRFLRDRLARKRALV